MSNKYTIILNIKNPIGEYYTNRVCFFVHQLSRVDILVSVIKATQENDSTTLINNKVDIPLKSKDLALSKTLAKTISQF